MATATIAILFGVLAFSGALDWLENRTSDWRVRATVDPRKADRDIVIVNIDNASFSALTEKLGRWPWTRRVWTELVRYLLPARPKLILFDIIFAGDEPQADPEMAELLRQAGNVVLPFAFVSGEVDTDSSVFSPPALAGVKLETPSLGAPLGRREWSINGPGPLLLASAAASGTNLGAPDPDGITRRLPLLVNYNGRSWAALWLAAALRLRGAPALAAYRDGQFVSGPVRLPIDSSGSYVIRWHGDPQQTYRWVPLWEVVCSIYPKQCDAGVVRHPASEFHDKIVFVGASAAGSYEVRPTAVSETAPGVFVLATALDNLLHNQAVRRTPALLAAAILLALVLAPAGSVLAWQSIVKPLAVTVGLAGLYIGICYLAYGLGLWLPMAAPVLAAATSFSAATGVRYLVVDRELSRTRNTLERYVSPQLVRYVLDHLDSFRFDGEKKKLTVFFSDVRGFTTLTEKSEPVQLLKQLNQYLEAMTEIVFKYHGIVDKFIGDGMMAHWGAFTPDLPNALLAAHASLDMLKALAELNRKWAAQGLPALDIGIGLNTGEVIFGNVGTGKKLDFTAIGDGVNLAARLESANKEYKTHVIISEATLRELGEAATARPLGDIVVKGKTVPVRIFELEALREEWSGVAALPGTHAAPARKS